MTTIINCACGDNEFRATVQLPVAVHISNEEMTLEVEGIYEEDVANMEVRCLGCGTSLGPAGIACDGESGVPLSDQGPVLALKVARSAAMEALQEAEIMTPVDAELSY